MKKELLKKLLALAKANDSGITEDEVTELEGFDIQKLTDAAAAGARKDAEAKLKDKLAKAEADLATAQEKLTEATEALEQKKGAADSETVKLQKQLAKMEAKLAEQQKAQEAAQMEARQAKRDVVLQGLMKPLKFVDGVDQDMVAGAFRGLFKDMPDEDLADQEKVQAIVKGWTAKNKAILADPSAPGTGHQPKDGMNFQPGATGDVDQRVASQSDAQRAASLRKLK